MDFFEKGHFWIFTCFSIFIVINYSWYINYFTNLPGLLVGFPGWTQPGDWLSLVSTHWVRKGTIPWLYLWPKSQGCPHIKLSSLVWENQVRWKKMSGLAYFQAMFTVNATYWMHVSNLLHIGTHAVNFQIAFLQSLLCRWSVLYFYFLLNCLWFFQSWKTRLTGICASIKALLCLVWWCIWLNLL